jgi:short-subunit dehydrogenase
MARQLTGQVIVITGASSGIGAATAVACAEAGMDVVLNARRADRLDQVAARIEELGRAAAIVPGDVTDPGVSARMLDAATARFGRFDAVFANAGYGMNRPAVETGERDLRHIFEVNYFAGVDLLRQAASRLMAAQRRGHLLMCSSCLARLTLPYHSAYCATKAAQAHFCRAFRMELRGHGIEVSSVHPITTTTELFEVSARLSGLGEEHAGIPDHAPRMFVQPPERVARAIVRCLRRPRPEVWTSHIVRGAAGLMTAFPRLMDWAMRNQPAPRKPGGLPGGRGEP